MFIRIVDGAPVSVSLNEIRKENPKISFPSEFTQELMDAYRVIDANVEEPILVHGQKLGAMVMRGAETVTWEVIEPAPEEIIKQYDTALDTFIDEKAKELGFRDRYTASIYGSITGSRYKAKGASFGQWMTKCYETAEDIRDSVMAGEREQPTLEGFLAEMPEFQ